MYKNIRPLSKLILIKNISNISDETGQRFDKNCWDIQGVFEISVKTCPHLRSHVLYSHANIHICSHPPYYDSGRHSNKDFPVHNNRELKKA